MVTDTFIEVAPKTTTSKAIQYHLRIAPTYALGTPIVTILDESEKLIFSGTEEGAMTELVKALYTNRQLIANAESHSARLVSNSSTVSSQKKQGGKSNVSSQSETK